MSDKLSQIEQRHTYHGPDDIHWLISEIKRLRNELIRIRDGKLSASAAATVALEALLPAEERGSL